jgi:hypothetical protein
VKKVWRPGLINLPARALAAIATALSKLPTFVISLSYQSEASKIVATILFLNYIKQGFTGVN